MFPKEEPREIRPIGNVRAPLPPARAGPQREADPTLSPQHVLWSLPRSLTITTSGRGNWGLETSGHTARVTSQDVAKRAEPSTLTRAQPGGDPWTGSITHACRSQRSKKRRHSPAGQEPRTCGRARHTGEARHCDWHPRDCPELGGGWRDLQWGPGAPHHRQGLLCRRRLSVGEPGKLGCRD